MADYLTGISSSFPGSLDYLYKSPTGSFKGKTNGIAPLNEISATDWNHVGDCLYNIEAYTQSFSSQGIVLQGYYVEPNQVAMTYIVTVSGTMPVYTSGSYEINLYDSYLAPQLSSNYFNGSNIGSSTNTIVSSLSFTNIPEVGQFGSQSPNSDWGFNTHAIGWAYPYPLHVTCHSASFSRNLTTPRLEFRLGFKAMSPQSLTTHAYTDPSYPDWYIYNLYQSTSTHWNRNFVIKMIANLAPSNKLI